MRILIIQDQLRIGGTERQSLFLARTFQESGHEIRLLVFMPGGHLHTNQNLEGISVDVLQAFDSKVALWAPGLMRRISAISPEIILCMGRTANCYAGFIQKKFPGIPVVGSIRTGKVLFPLHQRSLGHVQGIMVNSNWWKRRLLERGIPDNHVHVVHNSLLLDKNEHERRAARQEFRRQYNIEDDTCVFLNVATFRPGKRHMDLLGVFASMRKSKPDLDWRLWLVGDGREYNRCKRWAAENGLGTRVRFFHFQKDPYPFYAAADVAVSASREDSLPNFLIEAQATGLPVVAYDCKGVDETIDPGKTGIILPAGDAVGMEAALIQLGTDEANRNSLASGAPDFARNRFSHNAQAQSALEFLESVAGKSL
ncbi:MAG: glycosyltransferase [Puniceicoccaceae bacterium]